MRSNAMWPKWAGARPGGNLLVALAAVLAALFAVGTSSALAAYSEVGSFAGGGSGPGGSGSADGQLANPGQADVSDATGNLYVADTGNNRVEAFKPTASAGEYDSKVAIASPSGLAISQASGDVYVANPSGISKFTASLAPAIGWTNPGVSGPLAVDPTTGDLLVADRGANLVRRFHADGSAAGSFAATRPIDLAVTSSGEILVITSTGDVLGSCGPSSTVRRFSAAGVDQGAVAPSLERPGAIAIDPDDDSMIVATHVNEYFCEQRIFGQYDLVFLNPARQIVQTIMVDNAYATVPGLAAQGADSLRAYVVTKSPAGDEYGETKVTVLEEVKEPEVTIDPVDPALVGATDATFAGTVDPNGKPTTYRFEYSADGGGTWTSTPTAAAGEGNAPTPVEAVVEGLTPRTSYKVRLAVSNSSGSAVAGPIGFQTKASAPEVQSLPASAIGTNSARINGKVRPSGLPTTYHFEYGTTASYGNRAPAGEDLAAGDGSGLLTVSQFLQGLLPNTTYHFRLVAQNSLGTTVGPDASFTTTAVPAACPNEAIRAEQRSTFLPDCRAYEMVTPPDSRAWIEVIGSWGLPSGDGVFFSSSDSLPGAVPNGPQPVADSWLARRGTEGWSSEWVTDDPESIPGSYGSQTQFSTPDGSRTVMKTQNSIDPADTRLHSTDPYLREPDGTKLWLAPVPRTQQEFREAPAATPDLSKILVTGTTVPMAPDDTDAEEDVYLWSSGRLILQSVDTPDAAGVPMVGINGVGAPGVLSTDGRRVFFVTASKLVPGDTDTQPDIYVREDSTTTKLVSVDRRSTPSATQGPAMFLAASSDGHIACFGSKTQLVDSDTDNQEDVYCYDLDAETLERASSGLADGIETFSRPLALSTDGSTVFFATLSPLTADDTDGGLSLFARSGGVTRYVSPLAFADLSTNRTAASVEQGKRALVVSPDGTEAVFTTTGQALPSDTDSVSDVYRWTAGEGLTQISLGPAGGNGPLASATGAYDGFNADILSGNQVRGRVTASDGSSVFFESAERLVQADTDNGKIDVYEWRKGGGVHLISPAGAYQGDSYYIDNSADGRTVFFVTPERVLAEDVNGSVQDLYAARVGGGFSAPLRPTSGCVGEGCQGPVTEPPAMPLSGTAGAVGRGNLDQRAGRSLRCGKKRHKMRSKGKVRCVSKVRKRSGKPGNKSSKKRGGANR